MGRKQKLDTKPPRMTHLMLSGALPLEGVGFVIREMYENGVVHMEHQPFFLAPPKATGVTAGLAHEEVLQLPPPAKPKKKPQKMDGNITGTCVAIIQAAPSKPVPTAVIKAGMVKAGFSKDSTSGAVNKAMKEGMIERVGLGLYIPSKNADKAETETKAGGTSQHATVAKAIERAYPKWVKRAKLLRIFEKKGWRPESSSVATNKLKAEGKIVYGDTEETKGTYQWVPEDKRPSQTPPADSQ